MHLVSHPPVMKLKTYKYILPKAMDGFKLSSGKVEKYHVNPVNPVR
jgi:hypothetical protein